ncbi:MAG: ABC transporter ATP-binding protein [Spirochaetes bacterium]|nr:MAG: ABC transporter ATP-binding protein [Spirochaetota bacterium]RKY00694.1 MAG: ABC transporter ATP-binding protein [Spirochaetota bacterium]
MAGVTIKNLTKKFGSTIAVDDFSMKVEDGEFLTLLGPSGCGKTTILRCIAGFIPVTEGKIYIGEKLVSSSNPKVSVAPEYRNIGMVFQSYAVWPHMNIYDNITYPLKIKRVPEREIKERAEKTIGILKLTGLEHRYPGELSGGQQQRVALGRALIMRPDVLLLDEPLSNLDAKLREEMRFELKDLQKRVGITIVYVTHDQIEAITMSKRIVVLSHGKIQQIGDPIEVYDKPANKFVASFIGKANFLNGEVVDIIKRIKVKIKLEGPVIIEVEEDKNFHKGDRVIIMVRPHDIEVVKEKKPDTIEAKVKSSIYMGDRKASILMFNNKELVIEVPADTTLKDGDRIFISFKKIALIRE